MQLNLNSPNVEVLEVSAERARAYFDSEDQINEFINGFDNALDSAQGRVFMEAQEVSYIVIKVTP